MIRINKAVTITVVVGVAFVLFNIGYYYQSTEWEHVQYTFGNLSLAIDRDASSFLLSFV